ncbi:MAG: hypothetical protein B7Z15_18285, partial [Rhizobiales bacterium 32-66-8]
GCRFHTRCIHAQPRCRQEQPELRDAGNGHRVACHFYETLPIPEAASTATTALGKLPERLAAFEAAKAARGGPAGA